MIDKQLLQAIDACRPGASLGDANSIRDDLALAEMGELRARLADDEMVRAVAQRSARFDAGVSAAVHEVAVPAGLADRILQSIAASSAVKASDADADAVAAAVRHSVDESASATLTPPAVEGERPRSVVSRRAWLAAAVGIAASVTVAVISWPRRPAPLDEHAVATAAANWHLAIGDVEWQSMASYPQEQYPRSAAVRRPTHWARVDVSETTDQPAIVCDLSDAKLRNAARSAVLYIVRLETEVQNGAPPQEPIPGTGANSLSIGVWQQNGLLYVLVVEGSANEYRKYLRQAEFAMTAASSAAAS